MTIGPPVSNLHLELAKRIRGASLRLVLAPYASNVSDPLAYLSEKGLGCIGWHVAPEILRDDGVAAW